MFLSMAELQGIFACFDLGCLFGIGIKVDYPGPFDQPTATLFFGKPVSPPFHVCAPFWATQNCRSIFIIRISSGNGAVWQKIYRIKTGDGVSGSPAGVQAAARHHNTHPDNIALPVDLRIQIDKPLLPVIQWIIRLEKIWSQHFFNEFARHWLKKCIDPLNQAIERENHFWGESRYLSRRAYFLPESVS